MQMQLDNIYKLLKGEKTQTRRLAKPGDELRAYLDINYVYHIDDVWCGVDIPGWADGPGRVRWRVGKEYAIQPGRGKPTVWWKVDADGSIRTIMGAHGPFTWDSYELANGFQLLKIRITGIWREDVRDISEDDSKAEGFEDIATFLREWTSMHDKPAFKTYPAYDGYNNEGIPASQYWSESLDSRPADRYLAWALAFEVVK